MHPLRLLLPLLCAALRPSAAYHAAGVIDSMGSRGGGAEDADLAPRYHLNNGAHFQNDPSAPIFLEVNGTLHWFVFPDQKNTRTRRGSLASSPPSTASAGCGGRHR